MKISKANYEKQILSLIKDKHGCIECIFNNNKLHKKGVCFDKSSKLFRFYFPYVVKKYNQTKIGGFIGIYWNDERVIIKNNNSASMLLTSIFIEKDDFYISDYHGIEHWLDIIVRKVNEFPSDIDMLNQAISQNCLLGHNLDQFDIGKYDFFVPLLASNR